MWWELKHIGLEDICDHASVFRTADYKASVVFYVRTIGTYVRVGVILTLIVFLLASMATATTSYVITRKYLKMGF